MTLKNGIPRTPLITTVGPRTLRQEPVDPPQKVNKVSVLYVPFLE